MYTCMYYKTTMSQTFKGVLIQQQDREYLHLIPFLIWYQRVFNSFWHATDSGIGCCCACAIHTHKSMETYIAKGYTKCTLHVYMLSRKMQIVLRVACLYNKFFKIFILLFLTSSLYGFVSIVYANLLMTYAYET